jgi:phospholipase/lecithinase/hemolysin
MEHIMRKSLWISMTLTCLGLATMVAQAATPNYDALYVFGDSYCDVGNLFAATGDTYPPAPYYLGRFSDGPLWLDHVAGFLHVPLTPYLLGGTDYAFGGAWATAPQPLGTGVIPSVPEQVGLYLEQHRGKADPNALYIIEGGGNDIVDTTTGSPQALGYAIAQNLVASEAMLRQAGARHFVIPNLFNVGLLPVAAGKVAFASAASVAANKGLDQLLASEEQLPGVHILRMDVFSLMSAVQADPTHFGFIDIKDPCLITTTTPPTLCSDPDHTFFWDTFHPSLFGHSFFAVTLENALSQQDN